MTNFAPSAALVPPKFSSNDILICIVLRPLLLLGKTSEAKFYLIHLVMLN